MTQTNLEFAGSARFFSSLLEQVKAAQGEIEIGGSVVTIAELVHGAYRTKTQA